MQAKKLTNYAKMALIVASAGVLVVACTDDDGGNFETGGANAGGSLNAGAGGKGSAGRVGGSDAGSENAGADAIGEAGSSAGGNPSGGNNSGGNPSGGSSGGGNSSGGASAGTGGNNSGGKSGSGGSSGFGGGNSPGGQAGLSGEGGAAAGSAGMDTTGEGGSAGAETIVPDTLFNASFEDAGSDWNVINGWESSGDADADKVGWTSTTADDGNSLKLWKATAYQVTESQTLDPLPDGTYSFSVKVSRAPDLVSQYLFAKGCDASHPDGQVTQNTDAATGSAYTKITLSGIVVTSGKCTVGIYTDALAGGWADINDAEFTLAP